MTLWTERLLKASLTLTTTMIQSLPVRSLRKGVQLSTHSVIVAAWLRGTQQDQGDSLENIFLWQPPVLATKSSGSQYKFLEHVHNGVVLDSVVAALPGVSFYRGFHCSGTCTRSHCFLQTWPKKGSQQLHTLQQQTVTCTPRNT